MCSQGEYTSYSAVAINCEEMSWRCQALHLSKSSLWLARLLSCVCVCAFFWGISATFLPSATRWSCLPAYLFIKEQLAAKPT